MKKLHWGHGIFIFFVFFIGALATALIASQRMDHSLVVDDYYAQDLAYQKQYDKSLNSIKEDLITIEKNNKNINLSIKTDKPVSGEILFYRPNNQSKDFTKSFNSNQFSLEYSNLDKGRWTIKVDWKIGDKSFYHEEDIII